MKIITFGDLHGSTRWKDIDPLSYDRIIFLGDYLNSFTLTDDEIIRNFTEVIAFKHDHSDRVQLLLGNHELSMTFKLHLNRTLSTAL